MSDVSTHAERIRRYMILRRGEQLSHARGEIHEGHIDREWDEAEAALDALLEENATLRATKDRVDEECVLYGLTHSDGEAYGIEGLLKHIYANRDMTIGMERHLADLLKEKMEAAEALVVSLTEQRDELAKRLESATASVADAGDRNRLGWCVHDDPKVRDEMRERLGRETAEQVIAALAEIEPPLSPEAVLESWKFSCAGWHDRADVAEAQVVQLREALSEIDLETTAGGFPAAKLIEIGRLARAALAAGVPSTAPEQPERDLYIGGKPYVGELIYPELNTSTQSEDLGGVGDARAEAGDGENFAARMQEARAALKSGDEAVTIAYLLNEPVEKVRAVMAWSSLVAHLTVPDARVTAEERNDD